MKFITPDYKGENKGHHSVGVISNGMLYISGQLSIDPDTREIPEKDITLHTKLALNNIDRVLKEAGLERENVVQCRIYSTSMSYWDEINKIYAEFFGSHRPARVVVPVPELHFGCLIEIEAIAEIPEK